MGHEPIFSSDLLSMGDRYPVYTLVSKLSKEVKEMAEDMVQEESSEMVSFGIVAAAGQARSLAFEALEAAKRHDFTGAEDLMKQSDDASLEAHHSQTALLSKEAAGDHTPVDVLLVHAQDHLMTAMLAQDLIRELIYLHKEKTDREA